MFYYPLVVNFVLLEEVKSKEKQVLVGFLRKIDISSFKKLSLNFI